MRLFSMLLSGLLVTSVACPTAIIAQTPNCKSIADPAPIDLLRQRHAPRASISRRRKAGAARCADAEIRWFAVRGLHRRRGRDHECEDKRYLPRLLRDRRSTPSREYRRREYRRCLTGDLKRPVTYSSHQSRHFEQ